MDPKSPEAAKECFVSGKKEREGKISFYYELIDEGKLKKQQITVMHHFETAINMLFFLSHFKEILHKEIEKGADFERVTTLFKYATFSRENIAVLFRDLKNRIYDTN